jgi:hypothetical protein
VTLKLPRTIRLDPSDTFVFAQPAEPGEWAVTGSFMFWERDLSDLAPKERAAFRAGFVGVDSLGFSTLVTVTPASPEEREAATAALARHIRTRFGAPDDAAARAAAAEEIAYAASLCEGHDENTLLALHRTQKNGEIHEQFRTLRARDPAQPGADRLHAHAKAFIVVENDDEIDEEVDLIGLMKDER